MDMPLGGPASETVPVPAGTGLLAPTVGAPVPRPTAMPEAAPSSDSFPETGPGIAAGKFNRLSGLSSLPAPAESSVVVPMRTSIVPDAAAWFLVLLHQPSGPSSAFASMGRTI